MQDSVRLGNNLIATTSSGALLRFELPTVHLVRERIDTEGITCLGRCEGSTILAGFSDGRVCRVDPGTLDLTEVAKLPAPARWVGWCQALGNRPAGLVVVTRPTRPVDRDGRHWDVPYSVVNDISTGKTFTLEEEAKTFLVDHAGRVWLGADRGEWGGRITRVDLVKATMEELKPPPDRKPGRESFWEGVYGFVELANGQVYAFGGSSHMGFNSGYVTRVDEANPRPLFDSETREVVGKEPDPNWPRMPITHVVEEKGGLLVFSYSDVFRMEKELKSSKQVATLAIQYRWGRPDAVGSYPSVRAVHPPSREGEPYVLATVADGYVLLDGKKATSHGLPGQLGASSVSGLVNSSEGTLFFDQDDDELPPWTLRAKGWEVASLAPPYEIDPANGVAELENRVETWNQTRVLVGPGGAIFTVSGTGVIPGTRTTGCRVGGKSLRIGRETSNLHPSSSFITADGTLWNISSGALARFEKGRWEIVAHVPREESRLRLDPLNTDGPPWLLLDHSQKTLWQLSHEAQHANPLLTEVVIREGQYKLEISAAIPWSKGTLLLATDAGIREYSLATRKLTKVDFGEPPKPVNTLVRDGLGRLWLGGKSGLWMVDAGGKTLESFDRMPWLRRNEVESLGIDPSHKDGVIVTLGDRGVVFVRAIQKP